MYDIEYITLESDKRNLGLKGLEVADCGLAALGILIFVIIILGFEKLDLAFYFFVIWVFLLLPINISNKNRMYKIIFMIILYYLNTHIFIYDKDKKEGALNEYSKKLEQVKIGFKKQLDRN